MASSKGGGVKLPISAAQYRAIGHVVMQWAFVEREINSEIAWLKTKAKNRATKVNFQARFSKRAEWWAEMSARVYSRERDRSAVRKIAGTAIRLKIERDEIAHGTFLGGGLAIYREGALIGRPGGEMKASDIDGLALRISQVGAAMLAHQARIDERHRGRP